MLTTEHLLLREWRDSDQHPLTALNSDSRAMQFMPSTLSRKESDRLAERIQAHFRKHGFGLFAADLRATGEFIGFIGLAVPCFQEEFTPCGEIGRRLAAKHWNRGLATAGAREVLRHGFELLSLAGILSFTVPINVRSRRVMEESG